MSAPAAALPALSLEEVLASAGALQLGRGRKAAPLTLEYVRDLTPSDVVKLATEEAGIKPAVVKDLRQSHHTIARLLASGRHSEQDISIITGYSPSRISILKGDPAFQDLLSYYRGMEAEQHKHAVADMHQRLAALGFDTIEKLHEKLLDGEVNDPKTLLAILEAVTDRTGHGKQTTANVNVNHGLAPDTLAAIREGRAPADPERAEADRAALLRLAVERTAEVVAAAEESDGLTIEGVVVREESAEGAEEEAHREAEPSVVRLR